MKREVKWFERQPGRKVIKIVLEHGKEYDKGSKNLVERIIEILSTAHTTFLKKTEVPRK